MDLRHVSLRTLKMGYDLALTHPDSWRELIHHSGLVDDLWLGGEGAYLNATGISSGFYDRYISTHLPFMGKWV